MTYRVTRIEEIEGTPHRQDTTMHPVRHHLGITAFGTNAWTADAVGDRLFPEHDEDPGREELYVVMAGRARFEIDGEAVDAPAGTLVFVEPASTRTAFAEEPGTTVLVVGSSAGQAYEVGGWEIWAPFHPAYEDGDYEGVIERAGPLVEASGYPMPLYNLACCEALTGRTDEALAHLRVAFDGRPSLREIAAEDTDLDALRDEPAFRELMG